MQFTSKSYIEALVKLMASNPNAVRYYKWMLKKGETFHPRHFTEEEDKILAPFRRLKSAYKVGECYYNAQRMALFHPDEFVYYEGIGSGLMPVEHAWVTLNGKVFDITWERIDKGITRDTNYFGVAIPLDYVSKTWFKTKTAMPVMLEYAKAEKVL